MPISHTNKLIFIHIPKNAGESVEKSCDMYGGDPRKTFWGIEENGTILQHLTAAELQFALTDMTIWQTYCKFAIVRNPWSRAVSEYNWYLRYGPPCSFKDWVGSLAARISINKYIHTMETRHNIPQYQFLYDDNETLMVDRILKFENIQSQFSSLMNDLNLNIQLLKDTSTASNVPKKGISAYFKPAKSNNKMQGKAFQSYYDLEAIEIIGDLYARDVDLFGYSQAQTFGEN